MDDRAPDFSGLGRDVEHHVVVPPFQDIRRRYRRRQQRRATGAAGLAVVATFAAITLNDGGSGTSHQDLNVLAGQLAVDSRTVPTSNLDFTVTDIEFLTPTTGYVVGLTCDGDRCRVGVKRTTDGGDAWEPEVVIAPDVDRGLVGRDDPASGDVKSLRFLDAQVGYAFNPARYVTHDGGRTWERDPVDAKVASVLLDEHHGDPWFVQRPCGRDTVCQWTVDGAPFQIPAEGSDTLVRRSGDTAWYVAWSRPGVPGADTPFLTRVQGDEPPDIVEDPCPGAAVRQLSVFGSHDAWMACADSGSPDALKQVFRTDDGGATWSPAGTIARRGVPSDLVARSDRTAYLATVNGANLLVTFDGGATWEPATGAQSRYGFSNLQFLDDDHGFAMGDRGDLWRTSDGGRSWNHADLPVG